MKKIFTASLLLILILTKDPIFAQPVLQTVNLPAVGAIWSNKTITDTTIQPGPSGMNQSWNYSTFFINPSVLSENYVSPTGTTNDLLFPTANLKVTSYFGTEDYYIRNTNDLQYLGSKSNTIELIISNVQQLLTVPFQYGDSVSNAPVNGTGYLGYALTGTISAKADATGDLTLFSGAFPSTLRVVTEINLIEAEGTGLDTYVHIIKYAWYTSTYRAPVFQISVLDIDGPLGSAHQKLTTVSTLTTDISEASLSGINFEVKPNPAHNKTTVSLNLNRSSDVSFKIIDLTGRLWKEEKNNLSAGTHNTVLDISVLPKGVYILSVVSGTTNRQQRLIIE